MKLWLLLLAPTLLIGCARDDAAYPSLAPRAAEKQGFAEPVVAAPAPVAADPALDARLHEIGGKLDAMVRGYDADAARAERAAGVAGARTVGGEAWLNAQAALAALDDWRAQASGLTTDLDTLAGERIGTAGQPYPPLDALRARAAAEAEREGAGIAALSARLPTP